MKILDLHQETSLTRVQPESGFGDVGEGGQVVGIGGFDLPDFDATPPSDGEVLVWDAASGAWILAANLPAFATPAIVLGTAAAAGAAATVIRSDATIVAFDAMVPASSAPGDAAATGSAAVTARRDHKHARESFGASGDIAAETPTSSVLAGATGKDADAGHRHAMWGFAATGDVPAFATPAIVLGTAAAAGVAATVIRSDATVVAFDGTAPAAIGTAATGSQAVASRRDHVHPTGAGTPSTQAVGDSASTGTGPAAAMTDHKHAVTNPLTTQDDLWVAGASGAPGRLGKGSDGQVLTVDPTTHHLVWATPAAASVTFAAPSGGYGAAAAGSGTDSMRATAVLPKPTAPDVDFSADVTNNNVTSGHHGLAPKIPNDATKFLDGTGAYTVPSGVVGGSGGLLALISYSPAVQAVYGTTSSTLADVDATNLAVTFTAPASGKVLIRLTAYCDIAAVGGNPFGYWSLREGAANIAGAGGAIVRTDSSTAGDDGVRSMAFLLTGISAGSHTYKWSYANSNNSTLFRIIAAAGGAAIGAAVMEVWQV